MTDGEMRFFIPMISTKNGMAIPAANGVYAVLVRLTGARGATETIRGQAVLLK